MAQLLHGTGVRCCTQACCGMSGFAQLPSEVQQLIRARQSEAKSRRREARRAKPEAPPSGSGSASSSPPHRPSLLSSTSASSSSPSSPADRFPDKVSLQQYFDAAAGGLFRDARLTATVPSVDVLLRLLAQPGNAELRTCNYFMFSGTAEQQWDPTLLAKLAYEGFFTITHQSRFGSDALPLPELQPMCDCVVCCVDEWFVTQGLGTAWCNGRISVSRTTTAPNSVFSSDWCTHQLPALHFCNILNMHSDLPSDVSSCASTATLTTRGGRLKPTTAAATAATG